MMWFEDFEFVHDPYSISDPYAYPSTEFFRWNRDDLNKNQLEIFIGRTLDGRRAGLKVYGPSGSGKTWLARIVEKELKDKREDGQVIYTRLMSLDPTFSSLYDAFIESIIGDPLKTFFNKLRDSGKHNLPEWKTVIPDEDLAACLWHLAYRPEEKDRCLMWLKGEKIQSSDLEALEITSSIDRETKKFRVLKSLISLLISIYPFVTLIVDELENARPAYAKALSDVFRELIDSFYNKFSLLCCYTAERADDWYDLGYTDFLYRRLELIFSLDAVPVDYVQFWMSQIHETFRKKSYKGDKMAPFTNKGIVRLLQLMRPTRRYPGSILPNCTTLAEQAHRRGVLIDDNLVNACAELEILTDLSSQPSFT